MSLAAAPSPDPAATKAIKVSALARRLGVSSAVLSFLEGQFPEVRAIRAPEGRAYRAADAAFLAGLAEALYHEGRPFREVQEEARSSGRARLMRRGVALIGVDLAAIGPSRPTEAVPADAIVRRKGPQPAASAHGARPGGANEILSELMECVRILNSARRGDSR